MGTIVTDGFARVAATLGANWTQLTGSFSVNNGAKGGVTSPPFNAAQYTASAFALNQQLSFTIKTVASDLQGVLFRLVNLGGGSYSYYIVTATSSGISAYEIVGATSSSNGTVNNLANFLQTMNPGDVITIQAVGPNIVVFINGTGNGAAINITNAALSGTACGLFQNGDVDIINAWSAIDFIAPVGTRLNVVCDGDSHTWGQTVTTPWPSSLSLSVSPNNVDNFGVDGQKLSNMITYAPTYIDPLLAAHAANVCVVWAGTNDIAGGATAATLFASLQTYCSARRAAGWRVVTAQLTSGPGIDSTVQAFNALLAANPQVADVVVTWPSTLTATNAYLNTTYFDAGATGHPSQFSHTTILAPGFSQAINAAATGGFGAGVSSFGEPGPQMLSSRTSSIKTIRPWTGTGKIHFTS